MKTGYSISRILLTQDMPPFSCIEAFLSNQLSIFFHTAMKKIAHQLQISYKLLQTLTLILIQTAGIQVVKHFLPRGLPLKILVGTFIKQEISIWISI